MAKELTISLCTQGNAIAETDPLARLITSVYSSAAETCITTGYSNSLGAVYLVVGLIKRGLYRLPDPCAAGSVPGM